MQLSFSILCENYSSLSNNDKFHTENTFRAHGIFTADHYGNKRESKNSNSCNVTHRVLYASAPFPRKVVLFSTHFSP